MVQINAFYIFEVSVFVKQIFSLLILNAVYVIILIKYKDHSTIDTNQYHEMFGFIKLF